MISVKSLRSSSKSLSYKITRYRTTGNILQNFHQEETHMKDRIKSTTDMLSWKISATNSKNNIVSIVSVYREGNQRPRVQIGNRTPQISGKSDIVRHVVSIAQEKTTSQQKHVQTLSNKHPIWRKLLERKGMWWTPVSHQLKWCLKDFSFFHTVNISVLFSRTIVRHYVVLFDNHEIDICSS